MSTICLRRENGKRITIQGRGAVNNPNLQCVQGIVWRKNGSPMQTLELTLDEAEQLGTAIFAAIYDAKATSSPTPPAPTTEPTAKPITGLTEEEIEQVRQELVNKGWLFGRDRLGAMIDSVTRALAEKNGLAVQGGE